MYQLVPVINPARRKKPNLLLFAKAWLLIILFESDLLFSIVERKLIDTL